MAKRFADGGGSLRLFRAFGIDVSLHWTWILVALYQIQSRQNEYDHRIWTAVEYLTLFAIVLLHEFGHALACRQVGGRADRIVLWPLGGVAFVSPPPRPGAVLWSIVAGPLVNVVLAVPLWFAGDAAIAAGASMDVVRYIDAVNFMNAALLVFNLLPIYPLDGGKILWSLLWFVVGAGRALMAAAAVGLVGAVGFGVIAIYFGMPWFGLLAALGVWQSWLGVKHGRALRRHELGRPGGVAVGPAPSRDDVACPACGARPPAGVVAQCGTCGQAFDPFDTRGRCPACATTFNAAACGVCGRATPLEQWYGKNNGDETPARPGRFSDPVSNN